MSTSNYEILKIKGGVSAQSFISRITALAANGESIGGQNREEVVTEGIIGNPNGRALGSRGDVRIRQDVPQIWLKVSGDRTVDGWQLIGATDDLFSTPVTVVGGTNAEGTDETLVRANHRHRLEVQVSDDDALIGARPELNFTGSGVVVTDDPVGDELDVAISSTGFIEQIDANPNTVTVANDATLTSIYSFTVPGGRMGTDRVLRLRLIGDYFNNTVASRDLRIQVSLGGTVLYDEISASIIAPVTRPRAVVLDFYLVNRNLATSQIGGGQFTIGAGVTADDGISGLTDYGTELRVGSEFETIVGAVDTTADQLLDVSIEHPVADLALVFNKMLAFIDIARL